MPVAAPRPTATSGWVGADLPSAPPDRRCRERGSRSRTRERPRRGEVAAPCAEGLVHRTTIRLQLKRRRLVEKHVRPQELEVRLMRHRREHATPDPDARLVGIEPPIAGTRRQSHNRSQRAKCSPGGPSSLATGSCRNRSIWRGVRHRSAASVRDSRARFHSLRIPRARSMDAGGRSLGWRRRARTGARRTRSHPASRPRRRSPVRCGRDGRSPRRARTRADDRVAW